MGIGLTNIPDLSTKDLVLTAKNWEFSSDYTLVTSQLLHVHTTHNLPTTSDQQKPVLICPDHRNSWRLRWTKHMALDLLSAELYSFAKTMPPGSAGVQSWRTAEKDTPCPNGMSKTVENAMTNPQIWEYPVFRQPQMINFWSGTPKHS